MKWGLAISVFALAGCASAGIDAQHEQFLAMSVPGTMGCKGIQTKYTDLSTAPAELVANKDSFLPPQKLIEVWVLNGCKDNTTLPVDIVSDGHGGGVAIAVKR